MRAPIWLLGSYVNAMNQPNILCIYVDQLREDSLGCTGNPVIRTPNINRLALEGTRLSEAYVSTPLCTPFRGSVMTGKYGHASGVHANHFPIPTNQKFLPQHLAEAGYNTGYIGKWHLYGGPKPGFVPPGPDRCGFETFVGFNRGHEYDRSIYFYDDPQPFHCPRHEPDFQTDQAIDFMQRAVEEGDRPFFTFLCLGPPHHPMRIPEHWKNLYRPDEVHLPKGVPNPDQQRKVQSKIVERDFGGDPRNAESSHIDYREVPVGEPETEAEIRQYLAEYYGMIANVDWNIGRLLNWLDATGLTDDTFVLFFSDHGDMVGQHGYYCGNKKTAYRGSMQVPVIARWPSKVEAGFVSDCLVDLSVDMMPTLLDIADTETPSHCVGHSFLPAMKGEAAPGHDAVYYQLMLQSKGLEGDIHPAALRGCRSKEWLYVRDKNVSRMLFDLRADPDEERNLVGSDGYSDNSGKLKELDEWVLRRMQETGDDWDQEHAFPPPDFVTHKQAAVEHGKELTRAVIELAPKSRSGSS